MTSFEPEVLQYDMLFLFIDLPLDEFPKVVLLVLLTEELPDALPHPLQCALPDQQHRPLQILNDHHYEDYDHARVQQR